MPATADRPVPTALDILHSALERGVTGRLSRRGTRGPVRELYVMQGQLLAAHGPDDGPWIVRRLVNSGALTERQGKAFIRRLTRGIPFEELILGHVPDRLLTELLAGRFRQNLLDFLSSPPPIDFQPMDTLFVPNLQAGHDTRQVVQAVVGLKERIGPLMRHRGALTLRLGPSMPSSRAEARLVDLCDPPIALRDLLTYSPFETGETLDHVMSMLSNGALVSDEGVRLQRTRGHGPTADYAVEDLFTLDGPAVPPVVGVPAGPIAPDHLALLREESDAPVLGDFGRVPRAFRDTDTQDSSAALPHSGPSHLVLVGDNGSVSPEPRSGPAAHTSIVPVLVETAPSIMGGPADLTTPSTGLFEDEQQPSPLAHDGDLLSEHSGFDGGGILPFGGPEAEPEAHHGAPEPEPAAELPSDDAVGRTDDESVPESWRNLSALGFGGPATDAPEPEAAALVEDPAPTAVESVVVEEDNEPEAAGYEPEAVPEPPRFFEPQPAMVEAEPDPFEAPDNPFEPRATSAYLAEPLLEEPSLADPSFHAGVYAEPDPAPVPGPPPASEDLPGEPEPELAADAPVLAAEPEPEPAEEEDDLDEEGALFAGASLAAAFSDEDLDPPSAPDFSAEPVAEPEASPAPGNALVDAARRYLEEAQERRKETNRKRPEPEPEPVVASTGEKKFTGFDFHVDDGEMAMFADHDRYRGSGQGQFTLGKELLDKVELLPEPRKPERVRLPGVGLRTTPPPELPEEESLIEMGEATPEEEAEAGVVALAFSAPKLDVDQVLYKISVAGDVARTVSVQFDGCVGPGAGQTTIQLLVDAAAGPFARLFHGVRVEEDGGLDEDQILANLEQRPQAERRSLLDRCMKDFIERALSTAAEELTDEALDTVLNEIAGYQQRLRM